MEFIKMQGAGNDFILFDGEKNRDFIDKENFKEEVKRLCDRHFGVGGDGLMFSELSEAADIKMNYYNADGSIADLCGNGIRCFAKFVYEKNIVIKEKFGIETLAGIIYVSLNLNDQMVETVTVNIGKPIFSPDKIPVKTKKKGKLIEEIIEVDKKKINIYVVNVGNPHSIVFVNNIKDVDVESLGNKIENHKIFPNKTNVNFVKINGRGDIDLYTWERGSGRTLACGTGACAAVVVGAEKKLLNRKVSVKVEGGELNIRYKNGEDIILTGDAITVFRGIIENRRW